MKIALTVYILISGVLFTALAPQKSLEKSIADGKVIYEDFCLQCHMANGEGVSGVFPPLAQADFLFEDIDASIASIKYGMSGPITVNGVEYNSIMASPGLEKRGNC